MELKRLRKSLRLTQKECAALLGVPLRTYINYENDPQKQGSMKYRCMLQDLQKIRQVDEETGILTVEEIADVCRRVFSAYRVEYCYLFGSYAKQTPTPTSDVDLLVSTEEGGLRFLELVENLRTALCKKVDLLDMRQLEQNFALVQEILKDGVKIYG